MNLTCYARCTILIGAIFAKHRLMRTYKIVYNENRFIDMYVLQLTVSYYSEKHGHGTNFVGRGFQQDLVCYQ